MRQFTVSLAVVVVLLGGVIAAMTGSTRAQDGTPTAMADHPVVGAWRWENEPPGGGEVFVSYAIFHADGTYTEVNIDNLTSIGSWEPTGDRTADGSFFFADLNPDPAVVEYGEGWQSVEVDESGNAITAVITFQVRDANGEVVFLDEGVMSRGTRVAVASTGLLGTPMAATPTS